LSEFTSAWDNIVANRDSYRFILIETWNEWHEGTQIEPGQEIVPDPSGYYPAGYDYRYDFIDVIGPAAVNDLRWESSGHRLIVPVHLEAEEMIWDDEQKVLEESPTECRILEEGIRIGSSIFVPNPSDVIFTVRAKAVLNRFERLLRWPELVLYLDDIQIARRQVQSSTYQDYSGVVSLGKGIHKVEVGFDEPSGSYWDLVVDFVDVNAIFIENPPVEGFETGDFSMFDWTFSDDESWNVTVEEKNSGTYSAQAGSIEDDETTTLVVTLDCISEDISFYCKVSSESRCDYLRFYIDGVKQDEWSGEQDWIQVSFPVTAGTRTFKWTYSKDDSYSKGSDTAWIDEVVFPVK